MNSSRLSPFIFPLALTCVLSFVPLIAPSESEGLGTGTDSPSTLEISAAADRTPEGADGSTWAVGDRIGLSRADILKIEVRRASWGWVKTDKDPGQLKTWYDRLRVTLPGSRVELKEWTASADSLYGEVVRIDRVEGRSPGTLIPRAPQTPAGADLVKSPERSPGGTCFRAQACPRCDWVVLLEFAVASSPERCGEGDYFSGDLGVLRNFSRRYGLGATYFYGGDDCGGRYGIRPRLRFWLAEQVGLDFAPGLVLGDDEYSSSRRYPAFSGQIALDLGGLLAPFYQVDSIRYRSGTEWDSYVGMRMESYVAPLAVVAVVVLAGVTWNQ